MTYDSVGFPLWAIVLGWVISLSPVAFILGVAVYKFFATSGIWAKVRAVDGNAS